MAKMVGLSRKLKLPWLKYTVDLVADGTSESEIKDKLNEYLSYEIESPTVLRKTREILMNIWVYDNPYTGMPSRPPRRNMAAASAMAFLSFSGWKICVCKVILLSIVIERSDFNLFF